MRKISIIALLALLNLSASASLSNIEGLSSCRFSSKYEARNFAKALDGSVVAAARISTADLAQVDSCSTAMTMALKEGYKYEDIINNVDTSKKLFDNGIEATILLKGIDEYVVNGTTYTGTTSIIDGDFDMMVSVNGKRNEISQGIPTDVGSNSFIIKVLSDKKVNISSKENDLDANVNAIITKDEKGEIKSFSVLSKDLEAFLKPVLDEQGISLAKGLNMNTQDLSFAMDYEVSAMDCGKDLKGVFKCSSAFIFKMSVEFK